MEWTVNSYFENSMGWIHYVRLNFTLSWSWLTFRWYADVYTIRISLLHGKYHFPVGNVHLDSEQALVLSVSATLADGDRDRGRNQQKVIVAVIRSWRQPKLQNNYDNIIHDRARFSSDQYALETTMDLAHYSLRVVGTTKSTLKTFEGSWTHGTFLHAMPDSNPTWWNDEVAGCRQPSTRCDGGSSMGHRYPFAHRSMWMMVQSR